MERLSREALAKDPFTAFDDWLDGVEAALVSQNRSTILLALDEFEALDMAMTAGRLREEAVLGTLRHIIQYRPRFKLILAGSHMLSEFGHWSSYLINAQTIHLSYLKENEARQLIEQPMKDFPLSYSADASQRVLDLTHGHPYLVQLLCSEVITLKNERDSDIRYRATVKDVEMAAPEMLERGRQFFVDIEANQVNESALSLLRFLAGFGERGCATRMTRTLSELSRLLADSGELESTLQLLIRRDLIEQVDGGYRFQVEIIRCWFVTTNQ